MATVADGIKAQLSNIEKTYGLRSWLATASEAAG